MLVLNNNGRARLLVNQVGNRNRWLGLRLTGRDGKYDVLHTRVEIVREDGTSIWRRVRVGASYCSSHDPRVLIGLGPNGSARSVRAHWPDGTVEEWSGLPLGRYTTLRQGDGGEVT